MKTIEAGEPKPGGIANGIIGTMIMLGMAIVVAMPVGILCGAFLAENQKSRFAQAVSYLTDLLQGTPSVIIGIIFALISSVEEVSHPFCSMKTVLIKDSLFM